MPWYWARVGVGPARELAEPDRARCCRGRRPGQRVGRVCSEAVYEVCAQGMGYWFSCFGAFGELLRVCWSVLTGLEALGGFSVTTTPATVHSRGGTAGWRSIAVLHAGTLRAGRRGRVALRRGRLL